MSADEAKTQVDSDDELVDYDDNENLETVAKAQSATDVKKGSYAGIHAQSFRDFLLKPELLMAVTDCGFEHPSEVQQECIPQAMLGQDIICQAKSGMGKTAVFVLSILQQLEPEDNCVDSLVLCHTRELAYQICQEFQRFSKYLPNVKTHVFFGGVKVAQHIDLLTNDTPNVVVGTPGRILDLIEKKHLPCNKIKRFVLDECDQMLESLDMRRDVQSIFRATPHEKQVMMYSATLSKEIRPVCRKFTQDPIEIYVDNESKLTLHGLQQYYVKLKEVQKNRKLNELLDALEFNQVVIFVNSGQRCRELNQLLNECNFPSECIYARMGQDERLDIYNKFKEYKCRILVSTDLFGRGVDFERVNIVFNYDMPPSADQYLHRVGRSGRFGTKGLSITFVASKEDSTTLESVQSRFEVEVPELPEEIDITSYMS